MSRLVAVGSQPVMIGTFAPSTAAVADTAIVTQSGNVPGDGLRRQHLECIVE